MYYTSDIKKYGSLNKAIIMNQIITWVEYNTKNEKNLHDGKYWCYNTLENWEEITGISSKTIHRCLVDLVKDGFLIKGNYNKLKYDRTGWYTTGQNEKPTGQNEKWNRTKREMDKDKMRNGGGQNEKTIPEIHLNNLNNSIHTTLDTSLNTKKRYTCFGIEMDEEDIRKDLDYILETKPKNNIEEIWNIMEL